MLSDFDGSGGKKLRLPLDKRIILSVGGLIPRKGFNLIISAVKLLLDEFNVNDAFLVNVGEGPERSRLENLIRSRRLDDYVFLVGRIPHKELHEWYKAADLFCLASSREGWPNVTLESLDCGTPVVATDVWGTPEIIQSQHVGLLTKRNERDMASQIHVALDRAWEAKLIVEDDKQHTWRRVAGSVFNIPQAVLRDKALLPKLSMNYRERSS